MSGPPPTRQAWVARSAAACAGFVGRARRLVRRLRRRLAMAVVASLSRRKRIAIVAGPGAAPPDELAALAAARYSRAKVQTFGKDLDPSALHVALAAAGRFDAIIESSATPRRARRVGRLLFHVVNGGELVLAGAVVPPSGHQSAARGVAITKASEAVAALLGDLFRSRLVRATGNKATKDREALAGSIERVSVQGEHLVLVASCAALAKISDGEAPAFLATRGPRFGRVVLQRPGSVVENRAPMLASASDDAPTYRTRFEAPALFLREYRRPLCRPGQVVTKDNVLLPESYRHLGRRRLVNRFTQEVGPRFARVDCGDRAEEVSGTWFHLDSEYRGHFGHAMTEQISRLWAWEEAKQEYPDLRALLLVNRNRTRIAEWEYRLYEAAGVPREDLVLFEGPVRPERLVGATPMFSQPQYVHAGIRDVYRRIGDHLVAEAPERDYPERIFCSRRHDKRSASNAGEVEELFRSRGFEIVFPEDYSLAEQVQMFRSARDLAGFGGSAMFTMAFVPEPKRVFLISAETYVAQNEAMMAVVQGHQLNVAWCRPELVRPDGSRVDQRLQAPFTFDDEREGTFLRRILDAY